MWQSRIENRIDDEFDFDQWLIYREELRNEANEGKTVESAIARKVVNIAKTDRAAALVKIRANCNFIGSEADRVGYYNHILDLASVM